MSLETSDTNYCNVQFNLFTHNLLPNDEIDGFCDNFCDDNCADRFDAFYLNYKTYNEVLRYLNSNFWMNGIPKLENISKSKYVMKKYTLPVLDYISKSRHEN